MKSLGCAVMFEVGYDLIRLDFYLLLILSKPLLLYDHLGTLTVYFCRLNLSIALVSMVKQNQTVKTASNLSLCPKRSQEAFVESVRGKYFSLFPWRPSRERFIVFYCIWGKVLRCKLKRARFLVDFWSKCPKNEYYEKKLLFQIIKYA